MTVDAALALAMKWIKLAGILALLGFIILTLLKFYGVNLVSIPSIGWQEFGVFVAGTAYALKSL
jgi:hypothetical protein